MADGAVRMNKWSALDWRFEEVEYLSEFLTAVIAIGGIAMTFGILRGKVMAQDKRLDGQDKRLDNHSDRLRQTEQNQSSLTTAIQHLNEGVDKFNENVANISVTLADLAQRLAVQEDRSRRDER